MKEFSKNRLYGISLSIAKIYWKLFKPETFGARIIIISNKRVLLVQHRNSKFWNLPGGGINKNEDPEAGTLRELFEETKIKIDRADYLLGTYCSKAEGKRDKVFIYIKETDSDFIPKLSLEIKDAKWFPLDNLPETATPATRFRIGEYLRGLKNVDGVWQEEFSE
jgi:8-oxo-dGTP pyrophosphatase MutT (NUDIX family)